MQIPSPLVNFIYPRSTLTTKSTQPTKLIRKYTRKVYENDQINKTRIQATKSTKWADTCRIEIQTEINDTFKWQVLFWIVYWNMVFNVTFNNISVIWWRSVLLLEETWIPGENHRPAASHGQTLLHNVVSSTPRLSGIRIRVSGDRHRLHR